MKFAKDTRWIERYIAFDIHKEYALVGGQNARQESVMQPRRVGIEKLREWATANLRKGDAVILETTTNVWDVYDIVASLVNYTVVAHAGAVRQIAEARVKTDKKYIKRLIRLSVLPKASVDRLQRSNGLQLFTDSGLHGLQVVSRL